MEDSGPPFFFKNEKILKKINKSLRLSARKNSARASLFFESILKSPLAEISRSALFCAK
jgi:hypothetical protein